MTRLRADRVKPWNLVRINLVLSLRGPVLILDQVFTKDIESGLRGDKRT